MHGFSMMSHFSSVKQSEIVRVMETSFDAAVECVSQDLRLSRVVLGGVCSATVGIDAPCELFCLGCTRLWKTLWLPVFKKSLVFSCFEQSFAMSHFSSTQQLEIGSSVLCLWRTALTTAASQRRAPRMRTVLQELSPTSRMLSGLSRPGR